MLVLVYRCGIVHLPHWLVLQVAGGCSALRYVCVWVYRCVYVWGACGREDGVCAYRMPESASAL